VRISVSVAFNVLAIALPLLLFISISPYSFAENPTPYGQWNLNTSFSDVSVKQDPSDLHRMVITVKTLAYGTMPESTVNIYADITTPSGNEYTTFGTLIDMKQRESKSLRLPTTITEEGKYLINITVTSVGEYTDHVFDQTHTEYTVPEHGFETFVSTVGIETYAMISYPVEEPKTVKHYEALHAVINIDNVMGEFENIVLTHGDYRKDFPMDTTDIYMKSINGYDETNVHLFKEGKLFPQANAQNSVQEYVQYYKLNKDQCSKVGCISVNAEPVPEIFKFELWHFVVIGLIVFAGVVAYWRYSNRNRSKNNVINKILKENKSAWRSPVET
jgi:hypothetical protein